MRTLSIVLLFFNGIGALFGGYALMADPSGETISLPMYLLENTPFYNFFIPGMILFTIIGLGSIIVAVFVILKTRYHPLWTIVSGSSLVIWIVTQVIMIRDLNLLHVIYFLTGLLVLIGGIYLRRMASTE